MTNPLNIHYADHPFETLLVMVILNLVGLLGGFTEYAGAAVVLLQIAAYGMTIYVGYLTIKDKKKNKK